MRLKSWIFRSRSHAYEENGDLHSCKIYSDQLANYEAAKQDLAVMKAQLLALQENLLASIL